VYLLDSFGQPVPVGVPGELCIGGAGVTRGYLKRPDLTQAKFVKHPFSDNKEARLYRTGDLARYLPDGSIEYLGRLDDQLKIRGFRIELGEIETCLGEHEAVQQAVVVLREVRAEEKSLVAYVVMKPEYEPDTGVLRRHLKERLPAYMVPSFYVPVEKFPLLPNGKLNRKALPAPDWHTLECMDTLEEPQTEVEKRIAGIWQDVLGYEKVGRNQDFYDLGGHSLLATQLISRLREAFGVDLSLRSLLEGSTVAKLAQEIEGLLLLREEDEDLTDLLDLVEGLSDEEVKKLLSEKGGSA
jgi:acyl carrier protein